MIKKIIRKILNILPLKNTIIFESNPDFSDNTYWLFKYLVEHHKIQNKFKLVWFVSNFENKKIELFGTSVTCVHFTSNKMLPRLLTAYYKHTAKLIVDCNRCIHKERKGQIRIFLTHGMPIKDCADYNSTIGECDLLPVIGVGFVKIFERFVNSNSIRVFGLPRNQVLYSTNQPNNVSDNKFVFWMPTFRWHDKGKNNYDKLFPLGIPVIKTKDELIALDDFLSKTNINLFLRLHPIQDASVLDLESLKHIHIADDKFLKDNGLTLYEFIAKANALITDYSSVYYDYLYTRKPIGLTIDDIDEYTKQTGLIFKDFKSEVPGKKISSFHDLLIFIEDTINDIDSELERREAFVHNFGINELPSCELISSFIYDKLNLKSDK